MIDECAVGDGGVVRVMLKGNINPPSRDWGWSLAKENIDRGEVMSMIGWCVPPHVRTVYAPDARKFTRRLVTADDFKTGETFFVTVPGSARSRRERSRIRILTDLPADAALLSNSEEAFYIAPADCPIGILILTLPDWSRTAIAFHAGRDCLINRFRISGESSPEGARDETIVHRVIREAVRLRTRRAELHFIAGICSEHFFHRFRHPLHAAVNRKMGDYLKHYYWPFPGRLTANGFFLDLISLAYRQFEQAGFPVGQGSVIGTCSYEDTRRYSVRRSAKRGGSLVGRDGVLITLER